MDIASVWSLLQCAFPCFTDRTLQVLSVAREQAETMHHTLVTPEHMLLALATIKPGVGSIALERLGIDYTREAAQIAALVSAAPPMPPVDYQAFSEEAERLLAQAKAVSKELGDR
jgi:ATP-dependent Clp protease ATP-binding subunit ClpA